jgi:hypothetical protein
VEESGTYTVAAVYASGEGAKSAPKVVNITSCRAPIPDAAGTIDGLTENVCPEVTVELTIGEIENATSYQWYKGETKLVGETSQTLTVTQTGDYAVAGVNNDQDRDEGLKSEVHHVTITSCVPATPNAPQGQGGLTTNNCALNQNTLQIYTNFIDRATTVTWYKLEEGGSSVSVKSSTKDEDGYLHYDVETPGTYVVRGFNDWNPGPVSDPIVVTITECTAANTPPQGTPVILANNEAVTGTYARNCVTNKTIWLNLDNLKNPGAEGIAGGQPITGALSYTWYIYRADAPTTPVELETDVLTGLNDYSNIQLTVKEGGTYTVVARNDIAPGEESAPVVIEWIACPPAAPEWSAAGDVSGCIGSTVELQVTLPFRNAPGTYVWYKDGGEVARKTDEDRNKYTVADNAGGIYTVAAADAEGVGTQTAGRTVTFGDCTAYPVAYSDFANFDIPATFNAYDSKPGTFGPTPNPHTVTIKKAMAGGGNPVIITGLGGSGYENVQITGYFDADAQTISISGSKEEGENALYNSGDATMWLSGSNITDNTNITATVKKIGGKVYIYLPASGMMTMVSYAFWTPTGGGSEPGPVHVAGGVAATDYNGEGTATVLIQQ